MSNNLTEALKEKGVSRRQCAEEIGVSYGTLTRYFSVKEPSEGRKLQIAIFLGKPVDHLFPEQHPEPLALTAAEWTALGYLRAESEWDPAMLAEAEELKRVVAKLLDTLTPREARVLALRFGLEDGISHTLEEVGRELGVTRERIRQIEAKALRKSRTASRVRMLAGFYPETSPRKKAPKKKPAEEKGLHLAVHIKPGRIPRVELVPYSRRQPMSVWDYGSTYYRRYDPEPVKTTRDLTDQLRASLTGNNEPETLRRQIQQIREKR